MLLNNPRLTSAIGILAIGTAVALAVPWLPIVGVSGSSPISLVIERGESSRQIAKDLKAKGVIPSEFVFLAYAKLTGFSGQFKAGTYQFSGRMNFMGLFRNLSGNAGQADDISVTIPEGTNIADIDQILAKAGIVKANSLMKAAALGGTYQAHEGYIFPDTYRFFPNTTPEKIFQTALDNFTAKIQHEPVTIREIILASILEKEVKTEKDMKLVAGVIDNRLRLGMPLQVDATVAYGACLPKFLAGTYCDVSGVNLVDSIKRDTVYNTYTRIGLPAGPISNPGLVSLRAAVYPTANDYLYYLSKPDGTTVFSRTLAEHNAAKTKYLR
jgi:UPF0755 protein